MIANTIGNLPQQEVLPIFEAKKRKRSYPANKTLKKIREVINGRRSAVQVYSRVLQCPFWLANEGLVDPATLPGTVVTMQQLGTLLAGNGEILPAIARLLNPNIR